MAENHQTPTTEERVPSEAAVPESPGDVVVDFEKINDLVKQRNAAARDAVEQAEESTKAEKSPEGPDLPRSKPPKPGTEWRRSPRKKKYYVSPSQNSTPSASTSGGYRTTPRPCWS